jgi:hypothetical protein
LIVGQRSFVLPISASLEFVYQETIPCNVLRSKAEKTKLSFSVQHQQWLSGSRSEELGIYDQSNGRQPHEQLVAIE